MGGARIGKCSADHAWPDEFIWFESRRRTNVGLWIEAQTRHLEKSSDRADKDRIEVLGAETVETGIAFDTLVVVDRGPLQNRVDIDGAHGTDVNTISAGDTFIRIDLHGQGSALIRRMITRTWSMSGKELGAISKKHKNLSNLISCVKAQAQESPDNTEHRTNQERHIPAV